MSNAPVDTGRRRFLTWTTAVVGAVGAGYAAVPFIASWNPSAKAKIAGAPVQVDISKLETGQLILVKWRGKPVWVVKRSQEVLDNLGKHDDKLRDPGSDEGQQPDYAKNPTRSIKPEIFLAVGICTHLGCSPTYLKGDFAQQVEGINYGFFCPCHGSTYDMAGRVFQNVPAPLNLVVPNHYYVDETTILVGLNEGEATA
ncbi:ubiquinol-cytochrome c reductase iron-sulfur subunit [Gallaecimonas xiamenensis]|uniref:Ubiquinol-cytochrome c reductase iron-sulfur subunit n=1 Tax=Gallaecimonas xiamenensis 3-C-1 TaxID=745411 RepID=K2K1U4_9GAMM|nr:ubiquinol-cytochrome c reductase iron-sulfur subunit [Gallaecimonas xiamenensis]EKE71470.1 ubiquinol-cytochrome c reductase, iron-sulfur subunit [Gallaecimonas xiamenensis 3-C-1]